MALPSQTVRSGRNKRMMSNLGGRRPSGLPWLPIIAVAAIAVLVAVALWKGWFGWPKRDVGGAPAAVAPVTHAPAAVTPAPPASAPAQQKAAVVAQPPKQAPQTAPTPPTPPTPPTVPAAPPTRQDATPPAATPPRVTANPSDPQDVSAAVAMIARDPVAARRALTSAIDSGRLSPEALAEALRGIELVNSQLLFAPVIVAGDPLQTTYTIKQGDSLAKIARAAGMKADWRLLQRLNGIKDPGRIAVGQKIKVPLGSFHAVVHKDVYRMDVYQDNGSERVIVASFPVGLGERNGTPTGTFKVRSNSKLIDPEWRNPRTGEYFAATDPKNPIGEHWIGLAGADESTKNFLGYGIHGTIEPESIGKSASMGCVRMRTADVAFVYELLTEGDSRIEIVP